MFRDDNSQAGVPANNQPPLRAWRPDASDENSRAAIALIEESRRLGLCVTCDHAPTCFYRLRQNGPVLYCEEFA